MSDPRRTANNTKPTMVRRPTGRVKPGDGPTSGGQRPPAMGITKGAVPTTIREMKSGGTVLDTVLPKVYGTAKVPGLMAMARHWNDWHFIWLFAKGEQTSIDSITIMDREIYPNPSGTESLRWWILDGVWLGDGVPLTVSEIGTILYNYSGVTAQERQDFSNYAGVCVRIKDDKFTLSGELKCEAVLGGQQVYDFRDATTKTSSNVALVAYDVQTSSDWKGVPAAEVDTGAGSTWREFADLCDEVMSDGSKRYTYGGMITERDPDAVIMDVLANGFAETYYDQDGKVCITHAGPPAAIEDKWSATASTTITADGAAGDATSSLAAGDRVLIHDASTSYTATVAIVTNDDTVVLDTAVTVAAAWVRKLPGFTIEKGDWRGQPDAQDVPLAQIPDEVIVRFVGTDSWEPQQYPKPADVTGDKRVEVQLKGCHTRSQAKRYSITHQQMAEFETYLWTGELDPTSQVAPQLHLGAIVEFDTAILTGQLGKVEQMRWNYESGTYTVTLREFDPMALSDGTEADDTPLTIQPDSPDEPTACTQVFGESGNWDSYSIIANPDDITGWTFDSGFTAAYNGTDDDTELTLAQAASGWKRGYLDITDEIINPDGGGTYGTVFITAMVRWVSGVDESTKMNLEYWSGADHASATRQGAVRITPFDDGGADLWQRFLHTFNVTSDAHHEVRIALLNVNPGDMVADSVLALQRLRAVGYGLQGDPVGTRYDNDPKHVTALLGLYERWEWTQAAGSDDTVAFYGLQSPGGTIYLQTQQDEEPVLSYDTATTLQQYNGYGWANKGGNSNIFKGLGMVAVGPSGLLGYFPVPTQTFESPNAPPTIASMIEAEATMEPFGASSLSWSPDSSGPIDYRYAIPFEAWTDYYLECWVDELGGTSYDTLWCQATWPGPIEFNSRASGYGAGISSAQFPGAGYSYEIRLTGKYSGKSTVLEAPGTTWLYSWLAASGTTYLQGVPFVTGNTLEIEAAVRAAGAVVPYIYVQSDSTTSSTWQKLKSLPPYNSANAHGSMYLRVHSRGGTASDDFVDEFIITNEDEATEAVVNWRTTNKGGTRQYSLQVWRQADGSDDIWIEAKNDPSALTVELLWLESNIASYGFQFPDLVMIESDLTTSTTTPPSTGTLGFDSDVDASDFSFDYSTSTIQAGGHDVLTLAAGEIEALTSVNPTRTDKLLIEDASDSWNKKEVSVANIGTAGPVPMRHDDGSTSFFQRWHGVESGYFTGTGCLVIRPFGNSTPSKTVGFKFTVSFMMSNSNYNFGGDLTIGCLWNTTAWASAKNWAEWSAGRRDSTQQADRVRLMRDSSGYPCIVIGMPTDTLSSTSYSIDVEANRADAATYDVTALTAGFESSTSGWSTDRDFNPPFTLMRLTGFTTQFNGLTEQASPASSDLLLLEPSGGGGLKKVQVGNVGGGGGVAPKTTSIVVDDSGYILNSTGTTYYTLHEETSGGPWIIHNLECYYWFATLAMYLRITVDGTVIYTSPSSFSVTTTGSGVLIGPGSVCNLFMPISAQTSFKIEYRHTDSNSAKFYTSYQGISLT